MKSFDEICDECKEPKTLICPWCGCKGKRVAHKRTVDQDRAKENRWWDMECGACNKPFRSYTKSGR